MGRGPRGLALLLIGGGLFLGIGRAGAVAPSCDSAGPIGQPLSERRVALILSGGGAKGAWEAGLAAELVARGAPIKLVAGTSAGALNAALLAAGQVDLLQELWRGISRDQVFHLRPSVFFAGFLPGWLTLWKVNRAGSLFDSRPLRTLVESRVDFERVRRSPVRLLVVAADLERRTKRVFDNQSVTVDALMASVAVPGAFPPAIVDGRRLFDGGLAWRAPVLDALEGGEALDLVLVAMSYAAAEPTGPVTTIQRAVEEAFEMAMTYQIQRDVEMARLKRPEVRIALVAPSAPLRLRPLQFDRESLARALEQGRADGLDCLRQLGY